MSAANIIDELPLLTEAEREAVLKKLLELSGEVRETPALYRAINLKDRGIDEAQAADLRSRLNTFAEDWNRPEAVIYDEDLPR
jgi:hypothetical protein